MSEPLIILGYARVSTREQALNSNALEQQEARLKEVGAMEILTDVQSGRRSDCAELKKLTESIKAGKVKEIIVTRIDRLIVKA
ncbi:MULTISPECIES: recombinase family protein [unclassified Microcoleus]|uniref:recombinase family protein n=1 Tax=unclassified Microcoleus TaxID=2642155 RepID=UPI002FD5065C